MRVKRIRQCAQCPWKVSTDPQSIPGYAVAQHRALRRTLAQPGGPVLLGELQVMACHEHDAAADVACVGWLHHQLGRGNNIALRLALRGDPNCGRLELDGPQHTDFQDTLPKRSKRRRRTDGT